jgi:hypothetical protein
MPRGNRKKPYRCTHGKGIHHTKLVTIRNHTVVRSSCNFAGCRCRDYKLLEAVAQCSIYNLSPFHASREATVNATTVLFCV